jgi:hypothetical protein
LRRRIKVDRDVVPVKLRESAGGRDGYQQDCRNPDEEDHTDLVIIFPVAAEAKTFSLSDNTPITAFYRKKRPEIRVTCLCW